MKVRELREDAGYSQRELAEMADIDRVTLVAVERGTKTPRPKTMRKIAGALGVAVKDLREDRSTYLVAGQRVPEGFVATLVKV